MSQLLTISKYNTYKIEKNPELVQSIVSVHEKAIDFINSNPDETKTLTIADIKETTKQELPVDIVDSAWKRITYTADINEEVVKEFAALIDKQFIQ
ncbi:MULTISPECIES: hypothetical protein [Bacillaceae]|uniref:Uncharacterized protein n=1 Tax=Domibacillus aminovorans TaxID=29332 RepID=A0A177KLZ8_9BACI|nr:MULTISPECIES: hypothetical protein [Bacillaceae]OAH53601.1 hypothetical protein AWH48_09960 [Domibacillus aminovorans]